MDKQTQIEHATDALLATDGVAPKKRYEVLNSPWPAQLPDYTPVVTEDEIWFARADGQRLFPEGEDPQYDERLTFKLYTGEWRRLHGDKTA